MINTLTETNTKSSEISKENYVADGRVYIMGPFDRSISTEIIPGIMHLIDERSGTKNPSPIQIYINSHGGYADELFGLLSTLTLAKAHGIGSVSFNMGACYSCGSILAVSCDHRFMSRYADHLIHLGEAGFSFKTVEQLERQNEYSKKYLNKIIDIYVEHTKVPRKKLEEMLKDDHLHLDPKQCLKLGFCDEIF